MYVGLLVLFQKYPDMERQGTLDGLMPIEDSMMLFEYGSPKEARFFPGALHMGYPMANLSVYPWMEKVMATETAGGTS